MVSDHLGLPLYKAVLFDFNFRKLRFFSSAWNSFSAGIKISVLCPTAKERSSTCPRLPVKTYYNFKPWRLAAEALKPLFLYNFDGIILSCGCNVIPYDISPLLESSESKGLWSTSACSALLLRWAASAIVPLPLNQSFLGPGEESLCYCRRCRLVSLWSHDGNEI